MAVALAVRCRGCGAKFRFYAESMDEPMPDCPLCGVAEEAPEVPPSQQPPALVAITTNKSRAVDLAQKIAEEDYGLTNMQDSLRDGDVAAPRLTKEQRELKEVSETMERAANDPDKLTTTQKQMLQGFWGGAQPSSSPLRLPGAQSLLAAAKSRAQAANAEGVNPMTALHKSLKAAGVKGNFAGGAAAPSRRAKGSGAFG